MRRDQTDRKIAIFLIAIVILATVISLTLYFNKDLLNLVKAAALHNLKKTETSKVVSTSNPSTSKKIVAENNSNNAAKSAITKEPPKHSDSSQASTTTTQNPNGGKTVTLCESGSCEPPSNPTPQPNGASPYSIKYSDETGSYSTLEKTLKDFLNSQLRWGNEISYMYQITVKNAGATGWEGQYSGSYNMDANGKIVSAFGNITLNVYYHKDSPQFNDYMKLVLSHEYGHHYTLYHKWVDLNLPAGTRFPDNYYAVRPLSKSTTATDYSLGWNNCEVEIMAEDYSYLYSGYGYHAMSGTYGYPSAATKTWLDSLTSAGASVSPAQTTPTPAPAPTPAPPPAPAPDTTPPEVSITAPASGSNLVGAVILKASASDNVGVTKVGFYLNDTLVAEDTTAPYETNINTQAYSDGAYALKAVAYDNNQSSETSVSVNFVNNQADTIKPVATIFNPTTNPSSWTSGDLILEARATDDRSVVKMEFYYGDQLLAAQNSDYIGISIAWFTGHPGDYIFKVKAYDAAGNIGETTVTVSKQ
ncbi:MAG: Ig-like domain-containing protein [Patescibacteria group bacterium]|nr:Ig-like domain-containing protein [Patescibacteria group bacterium]